MVQIRKGMKSLATAGRLPLPANPLKTTTVEIYRGWQDELAQLQRRWNEVQANAQIERGEGTEEAEGLRLRLQGLRDLIAEAMVVGGDPASWRTEVPLVTLGSMVSVAFDDGGTDDFLFIGLAGPSDENVLTPKTPLGAAILGRKVGEVVPYNVGETQYRVSIRRCLVPDPPVAERRSAGSRGLSILVGRDEDDEAAKVGFAVQELLKQGTSPAEVVVSWRGPYQGRPLETVFTQGGIRYRLDGTEGFYDLPVVQGILALLHLLLNQADGRALLPVLRVFTHAPLEALESLAGEWRGPGQATLPPALARDKGVARVLQALEEIGPQAAALTPEQALIELARRLGKLRPELLRDGFLSPWGAVERATLHYNGIRSFLAHVDEVAAKSRRGARDGILLTPLDRLGNRQFNVLFLAGANEGALPLLREGQDSLPAERELFYGVLAAAKVATLSWARSIGGRPAKRSRFLAEIARPEGRTAARK